MPDDDCGYGDVICILDYNGSKLDILINYSVLTATIITFFGGELRSSVRRERTALFIFYFTFQIVLCCLLGCSGISIVWCAILGTLLFNREDRQRPAVLMLILLDTVIIVYYAISAPFITTIAHICALLMGFLCSFSLPCTSQSIDAPLLARSTAERNDYITTPLSSSSDSSEVHMNKDNCIR
mmetsp:Transcript_21039/g.27278  ORF Transcript_21039/g.27278 Transcript_21039/m.27278 type:complete len:183 (+) Transcript_21039:37-585(+)